MKKILKYAFVALMATTVASCHETDIDLDRVEVPDVTIPSTITGIVTNNKAQVVSGAVVTLQGVEGKIATTDANGFYTISGVNTGTYVVEISAPGYYNWTGTAVVPKQDKNGAYNYSCNAICSAMLSAVIPPVIAPITVEEGGQGTITTQGAQWTDENGKKQDNSLAATEISVEFAPGAVPENTTVSITPIFNETDVLSRVNTATASHMLIGVKVTCSDPNLVLNTDYKVKFKVDESMNHSTVETKVVGTDGYNSTINYTIENGYIVITTRDFAAFGIFATLTETENNQSEPLTFVPNNDHVVLYNNLFGASDMAIGAVDYYCNYGLKMNQVGADQFEALIVEYIARNHGIYYKYQTVAYPLNIVLPVGTAMKLSGNQNNKLIQVTPKSRAARTLSATSFGNIQMVNFAYNRQHDGGSSN